MSPTQYFVDHVSEDPKRQVAGPFETIDAAYAKRDEFQAADAESYSLTESRYGVRVV